MTSVRPRKYICKSMEKLGQDLKRRFLNVFESMKGSLTSKGNEDGEEAKSESVEKASVQERGIKAIGARGPKPPGVPKGGPPQHA